jgi:hypothetical protein
VADGALAQRLSGQFLVEITIVGSRLGGHRGEFHPQQLAAKGELGFPVAMAQKAVVTDALKTVGEDMEQEAANEFFGFQGHGFLLVVMPIIFPLEGDLAVLDAKQAVIGDGHAMGVPAEVVEDLCRTAEGWFGIDHPLEVAKRLQVLGKSSGVTESLERREEVQLARVKGGLEMFEEQAPKESREHPNGKEKVGTAGDPMLAVRGDPAARDHAMQMGMEE